MPAIRAAADRAHARAVRRRGITMLPPLGFNNTFAMLVRADDGANGCASDDVGRRPARRAWRAGFGYEFLERADGFRGLAALRSALRRAAAGDGSHLSYRALA